MLLPAIQVPLYVVRAKEAALIDIDFFRNSLLATFGSVPIAGDGSVQLSFSHIGGDWKNKQSHCGVRGGSTTARSATVLPVADAALYMTRAYQSYPDSKLATHAELAMCYVEALDLFAAIVDELSDNALQLADASRNTRTWHRPFRTQEVRLTNRSLVSAVRKLSRAEVLVGEGARRILTIEEKALQRLKEQQGKDAAAQASMNRRLAQESFIQQRKENERQLRDLGCRRSKRLVRN